MAETEAAQEFKLGRHETGVGMVPHAHPHVWRREAAGSGERLCIAPNRDFTLLVSALATPLETPLGILYVLMEPLGGSEPGRYQLADGLGHAGLQVFLEKHRDYFERDARHHLWVHSALSKATLVYDKHDLIFAYGPLDQYEHILRERGLTEGEFELPFPHVHGYRPEMDEVERKLLSSYTWSRTPLVPGVDD